MESRLNTRRNAGSFAGHRNGQTLTRAVGISGRSSNYRCATSGSGRRAPTAPASLWSQTGRWAVSRVGRWGCGPHSAAKLAGASADHGLGSRIWQHGASGVPGLNPCISIWLRGIPVSARRLQLRTCTRRRGGGGIVRQPATQFVRLLAGVDGLPL